MASLRDLQSSFAAALRDPQGVCAVTPPANLSIYRNNVRLAFRSALGASFPVVRRRVGEDFFAQLAHHYREAHPSRSGDLQFVGERFAAFLEGHLCGGDYAWLADLARVEWLREEAAISPELPAVGADALARFAPQQMQNLVFGFQPSLRLHSSSYPVFSVWQANQRLNAPPVDQSLGHEAGLIRLRHDAVEVSTLEPLLFSYLYAAAGGATLGEAMEAARFDEAGLLGALAFVFEEGLVTGVTL
jgi:hypothetical protein